MALTLKHLVARAPVTTQYPEERLVNSKRLRGYEIIWVSYNCTGCATCAKSCPQGNIEIRTSRRLDENRFEVEAFTIDHGRCMFCGLCVESCPFNALYMGRGYEHATYFRNELVLDKEKLAMSAERQPSGYFRPEIEETLPRQTLLIYGERKGGK